MTAQPRLLAALAAVTLCAACATTEVDPKLQQYTDQLAINSERYEACTRGYLKQYAASTTMSNDKVVRAAMKQCEVYAGYACHAQVLRDNYVAGIKDMAPRDKSAAVNACLEALNTQRRTALNDSLAGLRPGTGAPSP